MDEDALCPNCGTETRIPPPISGPELIPETGHPGIFYENLAYSQEIYELERRPPKARRFEKQERSILAGAVLLLLLMLLSTWLVSRQYDPDAFAITGEKGIRMSNRVFSVYYQNAYQEFLAQYSESLPFDGTRSLKKQYYNVDRGFTWDDYFVSTAYSTAALTQQLVAAARESGFQLSDAQNDALQASMNALTQTAATYGLDKESYLRELYGPDMTEAAYLQYLRDTTLAQAYSDQIYYSLSCTEEEIEAYYHNHKADFSDLIISPVPNVTLRHILFVPANECQVAIDQALQNANDALAQCHSGGDAAVEEIFLRLVAEYSQDTGSNGSGGLLSDLVPGQIGGEFDRWVFDSAGHVPGDTAVVTSQYGYHVVYFAEYEDHYYWKDAVLAQMRQNALNQALLQLTEEFSCRMTRFASGPN